VQAGGRKTSLRLDPLPGSATNNSNRRQRSADVFVYLSGLLEQILEMTLRDNPDSC